MNKIASTFLLVGHKFMHELYLRQPVFAYKFVDDLLNIVKGFYNLEKQLV